MSSKSKQKQEESISPLAVAARRFAILSLVVAAFGCAWYFGRIRAQAPVDRFAQCLTDKGTVMYGLYWCSHCEEQKKMFGSSFSKVHYVECGTADHKEQPQCIEQNVKNFPTWQFANGDRYEGELAFVDLATRTGCSLQ
jgi:glutaredoxin